MRTAWCVMRSSVPLALRQREEQRDAGQREKELTGKAAHHRVDRQPADVDADDPGERDRQHADVEPADAADDHGEREGADRENRQITPAGRRLQA